MMKNSPSLSHLMPNIRDSPLLTSLAIYSSIYCHISQEHVYSTILIYIFGHRHFLVIFTKKDEDLTPSQLPLPLLFLFISKHKHSDEYNMTVKFGCTSILVFWVFFGTNNCLVFLFDQLSMYLFMHLMHHPKSQPELSNPLQKVQTFRAISKFGFLHGVHTPGALHSLATIWIGFSLTCNSAVYVGQHFSLHLGNFHHSSVIAPCFLSYLLFFKWNMSF